MSRGPHLHPLAALRRRQQLRQHLAHLGAAAAAAHARQPQAGVQALAHLRRQSGLRHWQAGALRGGKTRDTRCADQLTMKVPT